MTLDKLFLSLLVFATASGPQPRAEVQKNKNSSNFSRRIASAIIPRIAWAYLCWVGKTSKVVWKDKERRDQLVAEQGNIIFAFWHGRQFFLPWAYKGWGAYVLVSKSKDGELIAKVVEYSGMKTVRGSSSRGGFAALKGLKDMLMSGESIGITPDGPRGPQRSVHEGVLYLAKETGRPILPVSISYTKKIIFRGWDHYWFPLPFNNILVTHGPPVRVSKNDSYEQKSVELKTQLDRLTDKTDQLTSNMITGWKPFIVYALYNLLQFIFLPVILIALFLKHPSTFTKHFRKGLGERLGHYEPLPGSSENTVWVHAASLGECRAAMPFVTALKRENPEIKVIFSSTTINGIEEAKKLKLGDKIVYAPLDLPFSVSSAFKTFKPKMLLLLESELWPNWIKEAKRYGAVVGILNGRISEKSAGRYHAFREICKIWMRKIDFVCARESVDAQRFAQVGILNGHIHISGNLKFDLSPQNLNGHEAPSHNLRSMGGPILTAGSVRGTEVSMVLQAYFEAKKTVKDLRLIVAPRHLEKMESISNQARSKGLKVVKRSIFESGPWDIMIWDTFGDLWQAYQDCDTAYVGGSLVPLGGQNPIEPASYEKPVLFGPHMDNFNDPARVLVAGGGAIQVLDVQGLVQALCQILTHDELRREMGLKAKKSVEEFSGQATQKTLKVVLSHLENHE